MRLATVQTSPKDAPVAVVAAPDGTWVGLAALTNRPADLPLEKYFPWTQENSAGVQTRLTAWRGSQLPPLPC